MIFTFIEIRVIAGALQGGSIYQEITPSLLRGVYFSLDMTPSYWAEEQGCMDKSVFIIDGLID